MFSLYDDKPPRRANVLAQVGCSASLAAILVVVSACEVVSCLQAAPDLVD